jgi:hypothetical protein
MEDQERGAVLLRLGGNRLSGGKNASPFSTWTAITGADVSIDGRPVVQSGALV